MKCETERRVDHRLQIVVGTRFLTWQTRSLSTNLSALFTLQYSIFHIAALFLDLTANEVDVCCAEHSLAMPSENATSVTICNVFVIFI